MVGGDDSAYENICGVDEYTGELIPCETEFVGPDWLGWVAALAILASLVIYIAWAKWQRRRVRQRLERWRREYGE